ncbi:hypothetical protein CHS0354_027196 [Potamilus streckersoni]|uniref:Uncharacterized protein n=1 Tax=Potamilus streckersoni TaxID=2493646 RepID=A0AAE0SYW1_9BIVA|nr:hypothetical protein CHS0354_027196 [Potamilus streckersoni]
MAITAQYPIQSTSTHDTTTCVYNTHHVNKKRKRPQKSKREQDPKLPKIPSRKRNIIIRKLPTTKNDQYAPPRVLISQHQQHYHHHRYNRYHHLVPILPPPPLQVHRTEYPGGVNANPMSHLVNMPVPLFPSTINSECLAPVSTPRAAIPDHRLIQLPRGRHRKTRLPSGPTGGRYTFTSTTTTSNNSTVITTFTFVNNYNRS